MLPPQMGHDAKHPTIEQRLLIQENEQKLPCVRTTDLRQHTIEIIEALTARNEAVFITKHGTLHMCLLPCPSEEQLEALRYDNVAISGPFARHGSNMPYIDPLPSKLYLCDIADHRIAVTSPLDPAIYNVLKDSFPPECASLFAQREALAPPADTGEALHIKAIADMPTARAVRMETLMARTLPDLISYLDQSRSCVFGTKPESREGPTLSALILPYSESLLNDLNPDHVDHVSVCSFHRYCARPDINKSRSWYSHNDRYPVMPEIKSTACRIVHDADDRPALILLHPRPEGHILTAVQGVYPQFELPEIMDNIDLVEPDTPNTKQKYTLTLHFKKSNQTAQYPANDPRPVFNKMAQYFTKTGPGGIIELALPLPQHKNRRLWFASCSHNAGMTALNERIQNHGAPDVVTIDSHSSKPLPKRLAYHFDAITKGHTVFFFCKQGANIVVSPDENFALNR